MGAESQAGVGAGFALRLLAVFLMTAMSAAIHAAAQAMPLGQLMAWRSGVALIPILIYMALRGGIAAGIRTRRPGLHLTRGLFGAFTMAMSFLSLTYLPVATAQALAYLAPVLVLPLSAILLHERINAALLVAIGLGFAGAIVLLFDALALPGQGALIGVAAGLAYAGTMALLRVHTKRMTVTESAQTIAFWFAVISLLVGLASVPFGWVALGAQATGWIVLAGVLGGLGHIAANEAVARAPISQLAPFEFTGLVWAMGFDIVLFQVVPGWAALTGAVMITLAAVLVTLRR